MKNASVTVSAAANIALIKYWGKVDLTNNQPATASLSIGLEDLRTTTRIEYASGEADTFEADLSEAAQSRVIKFLDRVREMYEITSHFHIKTDNNFPTGTGLASSASGFAALILVLNGLCNLQLSKKVLSQIARLGSGSAARSVYGGFVEVVPSDNAYALPVIPADDWPLDVVVAITDESPKSLSSTEAMIRTATTSPLYNAWIKSHPEDMRVAKQAIVDRDFQKLAEVSEHNCLKMHSTMMSSTPPIIYWLPATLAVMHHVRELRDAGVGAFFTIDAGSQIKVICLSQHTDKINGDLAQIDGVVRTIRTRVGGKPSVEVL